jgi:hypothetical protein
MSDHVMANSGECANLFKLDVETFDLFGERRASRASAARFALRSVVDGVGIGGSVAHAHSGRHRRNPNVHSAANPKLAESQ